MDFSVIFAMIWIAWINGSLYVELHGRDDGRTRNLVFIQMAILVLLAVFTADATGASGPAFAIVYAAFLLYMTWLWYTVRREDRHSRPEYLAVAGAYLIMMVASIAAVLVSAFLPAEPRLIVWAGFCIGWLVGLSLVAWRSPVGFSLGMTPTESLVERFGLFTIIVLGEVILGIVEGLSLMETDLITVVTGMIALWLAFGLWWIYFDLIGRRLPRSSGQSVAIWMLSHLPITLSIAAAGAAMTSLIGHAHDATTPESTAWLLAGSVALMLIALIVTEQTLVDAERLAFVYRPLTFVLVGGAIAAVLVGWLRPAPWLLALLLVAVLSGVWFFAVIRYLRAEAWGEAT